MARRRKRRLETYSKPLRLGQWFGPPSPGICACGHPAAFTLNGRPICRISGCWAFSDFSPPPVRLEANRA